MHIDTPQKPISSVGKALQECFGPIEFINSQLDDGKFDSRYQPKFDWFKKHVAGSTKVLNIGCGNGRETFALSWFLGAEEAIGIDKDGDKINFANILLNSISKLSQNYFNNEVIPNVEGSYEDKCVSELKRWYADEIPGELKRESKFWFGKKDIAIESLSWSNYFDLVYSRYVLDKIFDEYEEKLGFSLKNMSKAIKPETGRIVFVAPTQKNNTSYDYERYFPEELTVLSTETDICRLGGEEWPNTKPIGYICKKR